MKTIKLKKPGLSLSQRDNCETRKDNKYYIAQRHKYQAPPSHTQTYTHTVHKQTQVV